MDIRLGEVSEGLLYKNRTREVRARMKDWLDTCIKGLVISYMNRSPYRFAWKDYAFNASQREALIEYLLDNNLIETYSKGFSFGESAFKLTELYPSKNIFKHITIEQTAETVTEIRLGKTTKKIKDSDSKFLAKYVKRLKTSLNVPLIDFKRIYSKSPEFGGRVYSVYQGMSSKNRESLIHINGNPVTEIDYRNNHINILLYCLGREVDLSFDNYSIMHDYHLERKTVKAAFNAVLNSSRPLQTLTYEHGSFAWEVNMAKTFLERFYNIFPELLNVKNGNMIGLILQKFEGDVMMDIMANCYSENKIILPVHDSVICEQKDVIFVSGLMGDVWNEHIKTNKERIVGFIK